MRLPAALLFALDSDELQAGADAVLADVVHDAAGLSVRIVGHTDASTGTAEHNRALSRARAGAVSRRLLQLGLMPGQVISVDGVGSTGTSVRSEQTGGRPDPVKVASRRFVAIEFVPAAH